MSKNIDLERKVFALEKEHEKTISELKEKLFTKNLQDKYTFNKTYGIYESKEEENKHCYCPSCLINGIESPLLEASNGWHCQYKECQKYYSNMRE